MRSHLRRGTVLAAALAATLATTACAVKPDALTPEQNLSRARADAATIAANYAPLQGPLSLAEAIARALKYNYEIQLAQAEVNLQEKQLDLAMTQMLPRLAAGAGYNWRNIPNAAESIDVQTQQQSLTWSYSEAPVYGATDLTLTWNALDLGVSYFQAKQQGYRGLIAVERRRKVIDDIVKNTAGAYWRAAAAAQLLPRINPLVEEARRILKTSKAVSEEHLQSPLALLDFQQNMIIVLGELEKIRNDLTEANIKLATLINVPPTTPIRFSTPLNRIRPSGAINNHRLEEIGLAMRPELHVEVYQQQIDRQEIYKEIIKMLPGVGLVSGLDYNSNNLLFKNTWSELGLRASFNLFNMVQGPRALAVDNAAVELDNQRRLALSVAVLSQVNLSVQGYANALDSLRTADQVDIVGQQIGKVANDVTEAGAQAEADRIRRELTAVSTRVEHDRALANAQVALANVYSAVGADLVPAGAEFDDLPALTRQVQGVLGGWQQGKMPELPRDAAAASSKAL